MHSHRNAERPTLAIVGGESLLGKEIRELLEAQDVKANVKLVAGEESEDTAILSRGREEPLLIGSLKAADIPTARAVVLAGFPASSRKVYQMFRNTGPAPAWIDLSGGLEGGPEARLRAPMVETPGKPEKAGIQVIAHPAAIALGLFLTAARKAGGITRSVVQIFEPVSERGQAGLDELQQQTVGLLSFKPLKKEVFDAQVSFNLLPQYGSDSPHSLAGIEARIDRHLASLIANAGVPMPSLRLVHAPVFHGYSISVWAEFAGDVARDTILQALRSERIDLRAGEEEPPSNVGVAGQSGITVGAIAADRNRPRAFWFWIAADNLHIAAENAVEVAREFLD